MPPSLDNPFRKPPRSKKEADELSDLLAGKKGKVQREIEDVKEPHIQLSEEEQELADEAEDKPWTREQMEEWIHSLSLRDDWEEEWMEEILPDADWLDENLIQNDDGTWSAKPESILDLPFITKAEDYPRGIKKVYELRLRYLKDLNSIVLPKEAHSISLGKLESAEGLHFPENLQSLIIDGLASAEHLELPDGLDFLHISGLKSAEHLVLPKELKVLRIIGLKSAEHLVLPEGIEDIHIYTISSAEHLVFPDGIKLIALTDLKSIKYLTLPDNYEGSLIVKSLPEQERDRLREKYPNASIRP